MERHRRGSKAVQSESRFDFIKRGVACLYTKLHGVNAIVSGEEGTTRVSDVRS